jgi:hypothetical protein
MQVTLGRSLASRTRRMRMACIRLCSTSHLVSLSARLLLLTDRSIDGLIDRRN